MFIEILRGCDGGEHQRRVFYRWIWSVREEDSDHSIPSATHIIECSFEIQMSTPLPGFTVHNARLFLCESKHQSRCAHSSIRLYQLTPCHICCVSILSSLINNTTLSKHLQKSIVNGLLKTRLDYRSASHKIPAAHPLH